MITQNFHFDALDTAAEYRADMALEAELAAERRDARRAFVDAFVDLTPLLDDAEPEMCAFCSVRRAAEGSNYCSAICVVDAENS